MIISMDTCLEKKILESCNGYSETKGVLKYLNYCLDCGAYPERIDYLQ